MVPLYSIVVEHLSPLGLRMRADHFEGPDEVPSTFLEKVPPPPPPRRWPRLGLPPIVIKGIANLRTIPPPDAPVVPLSALIRFYFFRLSATPSFTVRCFSFYGRTLPDFINAPNAEFFLFFCSRSWSLRSLRNLNQFSL